MKANIHDCGLVGDLCAVLYFREKLCEEHILRIQVWQVCQLLSVRAYVVFLGRLSGDIGFERLPKHA